MNPRHPVSIPVNYPQMTLPFYKEAFGWNFSPANQQDYWLMGTDQENLNLEESVLHHNNPEPVIDTIEVNDLTAAVDKIRSLGGEILVPNIHLPGLGWLAYFRDPEGNILSAMEVDTSEKALVGV